MTANNNTQAVTHQIALFRRMMALNNQSMAYERNRTVWGGTSHYGNRDYYKVFGYGRNPSIDSENGFMFRYKYQDIAKRIIDLPVQDTWKKHPILIDGEETSEDELPTSQFLKDWQELNNASNEDSINPIPFLRRVDRLTGIGRYGVLLLGVRDSGTLDEEISGQLAGTGGLLYLSPFSEQSAVIGDLEDDPQNPRFGLPKNYQINLGVNNPTSLVHWSRVIHVAEELIEDEVYGTPRLEVVMQRLDDLMKLVGGSAEAAWLTMRAGVMISTKDGKEMHQDEESKRDRADELFKFEHDLSRFLVANGVEATPIGPNTITDPSNLFGTIISLISAATGIPQRILLGSERGELASTQDISSWAAVIKDRQINFAEPVILRGFINRCVKWGIITPPMSGQYKVKWPNLFELSELDRADLADKRATAFQKYAGVTGLGDAYRPNEFRESLELPPDEIELEIEETGPEPVEEQEAFEEMQENG